MKITSHRDNKMAHVNETRTTYDDFMKYRYRDAIIQATPEFSALMTKLKTRAAHLPFGGKSITIPVMYNSMGSVATLADGDALPLSLPGNWDNTVIPIYFHYFACAVSNTLIATSSDKESAFAQAWSQEILVKMRAYRQHKNRQMCLDGNAILCQQDGAVASQVITIDNAGGISGQNDSDVNGHKFLTTNMYIQARTSAGTAHDGGLKITALTPGAFPATSAYMTVSGTCSSCADGDYFYVSSGSTASVDSYGHEMPGLMLLIDDGTVADTVQSIACLTYPEWKSHVGYGSTPGTAEALTTNRLMTNLNRIQVNGGGRLDFSVTSPAVWLTYGNLADQGNQVMNAKTYDTGWPSLNFMGTEVFQDPYLPDQWFMIDSRALAIYQAGTPGWIEDSKGAVIHQIKGTSPIDASEAYWKDYSTLAINNRAWCGKIVDISVASDFLNV